MYVNRAALVTSPKEAFIKFECTGPKIGENGEPDGLMVYDSVDLFMSRDLMMELRELLNEVVANETKQE